MWKALTLGCFATAALLYTAKCYFAGKICKCRTRLDGKVIIISGASSGIGKQLAIELARRGARVILACRNTVQASDVCQYIVKCTGNPAVSTLYLDLTSFKSIHNFVYTFKTFDCDLYALVNNAGVFYHPELETEDGFDVTFQTNYLGPFLLTSLLLETLKQSSPARIVNVSSEAHRIPKSLDIFSDSKEKTYCRFQAYGESKLCLNLFTHKLAGVLKGTDVTVNAVNPGNVETNIYRHFPPLNNPWLFALQKPIRLVGVKTPWEGAQGLLHALLSPELAHTLGKYFSHCSEETPSQLSMCNKLADQLWECSLKWCNIDHSSVGIKTYF